MSIKADVAYVIQSADGAAVKVGVSGNPRTRIYGIKTSVPFDVRLVALIAKGKKSEAEMKALLSPWQLRGEWCAPRHELNEYLANKHRENQLLTEVKIDQSYCDAFIKPAVLEFIGGRPLKMNEAGDLVYRFFREGFSVVSGRMDLLHAATNREVPAHLLAGFVPLAHDAECPAVRLTDFSTTPAPARTSEVAA